MAGHVLTVRLADSQFQRLEGLSVKTRRPKAYYIKELLDLHLDELEDSYLALERLSDPKAKRIPQEEVEKEFGVR
jgi:RHH-type rel operon transcriptional repressor/antitoxin RelB